MAVLLAREGQDKTAAAPTHQVKLPQVTVRNLPVLTPEHFQSGPVTGRTQTVFSCNAPGREAFWRDNYERRQSQLTDGGFHGTPGHKYQEVGNVELDDKTLILQALGQMHLHQDVEHRKELSALLQVPEIGQLPNLRARTASQLPDNLMNLHEELERADVQLKKISKGQGLFHMFNSEKIEREKEAEMIRELEANAKSQEWIPAKIDLQDTSDSSLQEKQQHTVTEEISPDDIISQAYSKLCTILWILECMKLESPHYMPSLYSFWHTNKPPINEEKGRRVYERTTTLLRQYDQIVHRDTQQPLGVKHKEHRHQTRPSSKQEQLKMEEQKLRKQKKLSPEQIEKLKLLIEEELNHTKKRTKNSIKQLMEEKAMLTAVPKVPKKASIPTARLNPTSAAANFNSINETREMIVHEQLSVMARERQEALEQRFSSLQVSGNMWLDLEHMRQGVKIETTAMARNKLMMNYNWLVELERELSEEALASRYCQELLLKLRSMQDHMRQVGPQQMSQQKLMSVLSLLRPWELESPTIASAITFLISRVIYIVPEDYLKWFEYHKRKHSAIQN